VKFDDALDEGETDARPFATRIQLVEQTKYAISESWVDPHAVVAYKEDW
jgi:hypothetical protein